jgi:3-hydroxyacyl-CoA dehydrogenase/3-hydroxy-2-methylbutyryl-CoA dehydrogenase
LFDNKKCTQSVNQHRQIMDINNKVAVVTGGASGLGEATVRAYIEKGARVAIFDLNEDRGESLVNELPQGQAAFFKVNVSSEEEVQSAINGVIEKFGALHICNSFAGMGFPIKTLGKDGPHPLDKFDLTLQVNLLGTFNVARLAAEQMAKNEPFNEYGGRGVIINCASVAAYDGQIGQVAYSAAKGGVVAMTLPMARELGPYGIRVNTIAPGTIDTPLLATVPEAVRDGMANTVLNPKRLGTTAEIAHLSVMIVENEYLNAECIRLDGGIRMQPR